MYSRQTIENKGLENITSSATTYLLKSSNHILVINGTNENQVINLGNATQYLPNKSLVLISNNTEVISVIDNGGIEIARLEPYNKIEFVLTDNTVANGVWNQNVTRPANNLMTEMLEDWSSAANTGQEGWVVSASGTGATATPSLSLNGRRGVIFMHAGTTATGIVTLWKAGTNGGGGVIFGNNSLFVLETSVYIQNFSTAIDEYRLQFGYIDQSTGATQQDGAYFEYDRAVSGDVWRLVTASNTTRNTVITAIPVLQNGWHKYRIESNRAGTRINFFIDNVFVGFSNANIPNTTGRNTDIGYRLAKLVGTNIRPIFIDYAVERTYITR